MDTLRRLLSGSSRHLDWALLVLRVGIGIMFMFHGYPKMTGGPEVWAQYGMRGVGSIGIDTLHTFWGFMAAFSELVGGFCVAIGLLFRPALVLMFITMVFAALSHIVSGRGSPYHAMESGTLFLSLIWIGAGRFSLDEKLFSRPE